MLYIDIAKLSVSDLCFHIGSTVETDIKNQKLKKQDVAKSAGITPMSLYRLCKGENTSLEVYLKVLKAINRLDVVEAMTSATTVMPISYYESFKRKKKEKQSEIRKVSWSELSMLETSEWKE